MSDRGLGLEAYEDDDERTSPEMEPGTDVGQREDDAQAGAGILALGLAGHGFDGDFVEHGEGSESVADDAP